ncbi:MAG: arylsulfatase [Luteolibacter sp.]|jgi:arylsulfatase A-like enzyme
MTSDKSSAAMRPNVILILADDMGFSDMGCFGSEIRTPNIDRMAREGAALSAMYNCARCCPTRASLLTGLYPHRAGIGHMGANLGSRAYQGYLSNNSVTIAEVLRLSGYRTLMSGKWHVGGDFDAREIDSWRIGDLGHPTPRQRGFDEFYGMVDGAASFFSPHCILRNDGRVEITQADFHFTDAITDAAIGMIEKAAQDAQPFFLYLAYTAPHWPLHAHEEDIAAYDSVYMSGWDHIRTARHEDLNSRKLLRKPWDISPRDAGAPPWAAITHRDWEARRMQTYAAMVEQMDRGIGKVLARLETLGMGDNTLVMFLSDNGGCAELMEEEGWAQYYPRVNHDGSIVRPGNRTDLPAGGKDTFMSYDLPWANVSNAPFRLFKHWVHEGGISTPLIARWPAGIRAPVVAHEPTHVVDILPTILDVTGAAYPADFGGHAVHPMEGESILPMLQGADWQREQPIFWEHEGNAALRFGPWKLVRRHGQDWELYEMDEDRTELHDLAALDPVRVRQMAREWKGWADGIGVRDWNDLRRTLARLWGMESTE